MSLRPAAGDRSGKATDASSSGVHSTGRSPAVRPPQRVVGRSCRHCGAEFEAVRHQTFCRPSCRWEFFKAKRARGYDVEADLLQQPFE